MYSRYGRATITCCSSRLLYTITFPFSSSSFDSTVYISSQNFAIAMKSLTPYVTSIRARTELLLYKHFHANWELLVWGYHKAIELLIFGDAEHLLYISSVKPVPKFARSLYRRRKLFFLRNLRSWTTSWELYRPLQEFIGGIFCPSEIIQGHKQVFWSQLLHLDISYVSNSTFELQSFKNCKLSTPVSET